MSDWQPSISLNNLEVRARLLDEVRSFFKARQVLEVETPLACRYTVTEPNIESFALELTSDKRYLQTSPEYAMKRLLSAGAPDIYQICKAFRRSEQGSRHNPEFTLIEWYRKGFNLKQIMNETATLIEQIVASPSSNQVCYMSYDDFFLKSLGRSFSDLAASDIEEIAVQLGLCINSNTVSHAQMIDFIFSSLVSEHIQDDRLTCIYHYPCKQAALAKLNDNDASLAERFEVFYGGFELANGYVELTDGNIQQQRFEADRDLRRQQQQDEIEIDTRLIAAQQHGLPECAGVALGFDRLMMLALGAKTIEEVIAFSWANA